jgi:Ala-tRNA(Pro) deacylase
VPSKLLLEYLDRAGAQYKLSRHRRAYSAPMVAECSHTQGGCLAKATMVMLNDELVMIVLPAHYSVHVELLADTLRVRSVRLATEQEFQHHFPRCELGAIPPFGHLYGVEAYMMQVFDEYTSITFNAGSHTELITMPFWEYERLAYVHSIPRGVVPPSWTPLLSRSEIQPQYWKAH